MQVQELCDGTGQLMYSLYGVVVHSGNMQDGHYVAYTRAHAPPQPMPTEIKHEAEPSVSESPAAPGPGAGSPGQKSFDYSSTEGQWYHASDTHVRTATEAEVLKSQAYLLFYERLPFTY